MIQKRYQHYDRNGVSWTDWFNTSKKDFELPTLLRFEKWQVKNKLLNDFRIIEEG